jgi:RHS repeat-associated protein
MSYKTGNYSLFSLKMRQFGYKSPRNRVKTLPAVTIHRGNFCPKKFTGKERDSETGLYYYGARYLDSKTSRWLSGDPAMGEYVPSAPVDDEARKRNKNLPGMGGVFNYVNLHVYHYAGNNPVKYVDPNGMMSEDEITENAAKNLTENPQKPIPEVTQDYLASKGWTVTTEADRAEINNELKESASADNPHSSVSSRRSEESVQYEIPLTEREQQSNALRDALRNRGYPDRNSTGRTLPRIGRHNYPNARIFSVKVRNEETGETYHIRKEYIDINGDGHIDGWRGAK